MKISKYAALIKKKGYGVWINTTEGTVFLMTNASMYKADGLPRAETEEQAAIMLDIEEKKRDKMFFELKEAAGPANVLGFDLSSGVTATEKSAEEIKMKVVEGDTLCNVLLCEDGELLFYDKTYLAPIADVLKEEPLYITYAVRWIGRKPYIVVKDGILVIAALMPVKVLSDDYIKKMQDFQKMCIDQLEREKAIGQTVE